MTGPLWFAALLITSFCAGLRDPGICAVGIVFAIGAIANAVESHK